MSRYIVIAGKFLEVLNEDFDIYKIADDVCSLIQTKKEIEEPFVHDILAGVIQYLETEKLAVPVYFDNLSEEEESRIIETSKRYLISIPIPSSTDMDTFRANFPEYKDMETGQAEFIATGYRLPEFIEIAKGDMQEASRIFYSWLEIGDVSSFNEKKELLFLRQFTNRQKEHIRLVGHSVIGVGSDDVSPAYSYSVGLTNTLGYELITAGVSTGEVINEVAELLKNDSVKVNEVFTLDSFTVIGKGPLKVKVVDRDYNDDYKSLVFSKIPTVTITAIKQILLGDKNNILPDEEGYDTNFNQVLVK